MIDLEDHNCAQLRQAIGPTVVTGSENDDLIEASIDCGAESVIDEPRSPKYVSSHSGVRSLSEPKDGISEHGDPT
jgi:hypothetical protein